jgi:hypothetical protein
VFRGDGSMDVKKFLFLFENVITKGLEPEKKAKEILLYLEGEAFDFYYDKFASGDAILEEAEDYRKVKAALLERFSESRDPETVIRDAVEVSLVGTNITDLWKKQVPYISKQV